MKGKDLLNLTHALKWRDLHNIRSHIFTTLLEQNLSRRHVDSIIMIISELLENAFLYCNKKEVTIRVQIHPKDKNILMIRVHTPVSSLSNPQVQELKQNLDAINGEKDTNRLFVEALRASHNPNRKKDKNFRLILCRKIADGASLYLRKSPVYDPGVVLILPFSL